MRALVLEVYLLQAYSQVPAPLKLRPYGAIEIRLLLLLLLLLQRSLFYRLFRM